MLNEVIVKVSKRDNNTHMQNRAYFETWSRGIFSDLFNFIRRKQHRRSFIYLKLRWELFPNKWSKNVIVELTTPGSNITTTGANDRVNKRNSVAHYHN